MADFLERLRTGPPIVADGGMGALLIGATPGLRCPEEANLRAPESVIAVHASYIRAGAELIETNTFGANRRKLAGKLPRGRVRGDQLGGRPPGARGARRLRPRRADRRARSGRSASWRCSTRASTGRCTPSRPRVLEGRGVDLFMIETFFDLDQLVAAVEAVRGVSSLPIVALLTFDDEAETGGGIDAAAAGRRLAELDVAAIGTNHGAGPHAALLALDAMRDSGVPLAALPNIGLASIVGGRVVYPHSTPEYFGDFAAQAAALGARIVGGCCGTTPAQIEAIRDGARRRARAAGGRSRRASSPRSRLPIPAVGETRLARALREGEWVVSVELDPPKGGTNDAMIEVARALRQSGAVGFVDVNDNPMARARMNALMASIAIQREAGIETIPHVTPRDTTVMGLEGVLLGAHADGVRNILAVTGDPPHVGDYPGSRGVYEIDSIGLVQLLAGLNQGVDYVGKAIDRPTSFFIGVAVNPTADDLDLELERFERKVASGAQFAMTQALFDLEGLELLPRAARRLLADPAARRRLAAPVTCDGAAAPQRGAGDLRSRPRARLRCVTPGPTRPRRGSRSRASCSRRCAAASRGST